MTLELREEATKVGVFTIDHQFRGPASSGNGGYVCGRLAEYIDGPASVSLRVPPPLDTPISVYRDDTGVVALVDESVVGTAKPTELSLDVPALPGKDAIQAARASYLADAEQHALPHCFVCGPRRAEGDGLRLFAGLIPSGELAATAWTPSESLADGDGRVRPEFLWAALDCPSYFSLGLMGRFALLANLSARVIERPRAETPLSVIAWPSRSEGRKHFANSAVVDPSGRPLAIASALWVEVKEELKLKLMAENG